VSAASANTAKKRVLKKYPKAYARYVGLSMRFVIVADHFGAELSGYRFRERDAWADAARKL
jgi:hypothetical protein